MTLDGAADSASLAAGAEAGAAGASARLEQDRLDIAS
ncbi:MAG: hypothetical protein CM1200mP40_19940 [Gammaproteobacteria bacterium]|nr:MAG: hypothetical protein CM1200mP40_19940 [Gammaproteobacteria bacterium]